MKSTIVVKSSNRKINLYHNQIEGAIANVIIVHGASEYIDRYNKISSYLNDNMINTFGYNQISHGEYIDNNRKNIFFSEENADKLLVKNLEDIVKKVTNINSLPIYIIGHSMGSLVARAFAINNNYQVKGIVLSGTLNPPIITINSGLRFAKIITKINGKKNVSKLLNNLAFGNIAQRLSYNKKNINVYLKDSKCGAKFSNQAIIDLLALTKYVCNYKNIKNMLKTNYLVISGDNDKFSNNSKQLTSLIKIMKKSEHNVDYMIFKKMKHEIFNEDEYLKVFVTIKEFIDKSIR